MKIKTQTKVQNTHGKVRKKIKQEILPFKCKMHQLNRIKGKEKKRK